MLCVLSTLFRLLKFPHEGKIITVDQLSFFTLSSENNVPYMDQIPNPLDGIEPGLFKDPVLMGIFPIPPLNTIQFNMLSQSDDPWIIPSPKQVDSFGDSMPLSPIKINYCELTTTSDSPLPEATPLSLSEHSSFSCVKLPTYETS